MPDAARPCGEESLHWTEVRVQARPDAARAGANLPLDWENLAEAAGDSGISRRNAQRSRVATIVEHVARLEFPPAHEPRRGWAETVLRARLRIERSLRDSPSLGRGTAEIIEDQTTQDDATPALLARVAAISCAEDQVLGGRFLARTGASAA
jgi:hypothetical protein